MGTRLFAETVFALQAHLDSRLLACKIRLLGNDAVLTNWFAKIYQWIYSLIVRYWKSLFFIVSIGHKGPDSYRLLEVRNKLTLQIASFFTV